MEGSPEAGESDYLGPANLAPADNIPPSLGNQFRVEIHEAMVLGRRRSKPARTEGADAKIETQRELM